MGILRDTLKPGEIKQDYEFIKKYGSGKPRWQKDALVNNARILLDAESPTPESLLELKEKVIPLWARITRKEKRKNVLVSEAVLEDFEIRCRANKG